MEQYIINICNKFCNKSFTIKNDESVIYNFGSNNSFDKIKNIESIKIIYNLFKNGTILPCVNNDSIVYLYYGYYFEYINKNYDEMKKNYKTAIKMGNSRAADKLGTYYLYEKKNYIKMKKYYLIGIKMGNLSSINNIANYYAFIKKYDKMKKYYHIGIKKGYVNCMLNLAFYYDFIKKYDKMEKYYLMAVREKNVDAKIKLLDYYNKNILNIRHFNNVVKILYELNEHKLRFNYITYGLNNNKYINYYLIIDYVCTINLQFNILKYIKKPCNKIILYENYNKILLLLFHLTNNKINISKYIKLNIIYFITQ